MDHHFKEALAAEQKQKGRKLTKNEKNRLKSKISKASGNTSQKSSVEEKGKKAKKFIAPPKLSDRVEYISENLDETLASASESGIVGENAMEEFKSVFTKFAKVEELLESHESKNSGDAENFESMKENGNDSSDTSRGSDSDSDGSLKVVGNRQMKKLMRMSVAALKQQVDRPDLVDIHDVASPDPELLIALKSKSKTVPIPQHWSQKRKYLQGGRGREKPPYKLPDFIEETGISRIKDSLMEEEERKAAKAKARARVRPSVGKIDIDYQVLHDAFFKYQTKPRLTSHGDIYFENKEYESSSKSKHSKPGKLSMRLLEALGVDPEGPVARNPALFCPPWLMNQQRYGPPPSYPNLKIPGLNCPIPVALGARFGYHSGGWGKPPVDEYGRPIYGDVFGTEVAIDEGEEVIDRTHWGEFQPDDGFADGGDEGSDSEGEEEEAARVGIQGASHGYSDPASARGGMVGIKNYREVVADTSGWSVDASTGVPIPPSSSGDREEGAKPPQDGEGVDAYLSKETINLRKRAEGQAVEDDEPASGVGKEKKLYTIVKENAASTTSSGTLFGITASYSLKEQDQAENEDKGSSDENKISIVDGVPASEIHKQDGGLRTEKETKEKKRKRMEESAASKFKDFKF